MKKLLYLLLAAALSLGCLCVAAGCSEGSGQPAGGVANDAPEGYVTLKKFDSWREMQLNHYSADFGYVKINTDPQYITEGVASAEIKAEGDMNNRVMPKITIDTDDEYFLTQDFSGYDGLLFDVYNTSDEASTVRVSMAVEDGYGTVYTYPMDFALAPKAWTKVNYDFTDGGFTAAAGLTKVVNVIISFPDYRTSVEETAKVFYLDGMIAKESETPVAPAAPAREAGEIMFFESPLDLNLLRYTQNMSAELEVNRTYVSQGNSSLHLTGTGTIALKPSIAAGAAYSGISVDVMHPDAAAKNMSVSVTYFDESTREYAAVSVQVSVSGNARTTVTFDASRIEGVCEWEDVELISFVTNASQTWLDNWQFTSAEA